MPRVSAARLMSSVHTGTVGNRPLSSISAYNRNAYAVWYWDTYVRRYLRAHAHAGRERRCARCDSATPHRP